MSQISPGTPLSTKITLSLNFAIAWPLFAISNILTLFIIVLSLAHLANLII